MKAFIFEANKDGSSKCGGGRVTPEYKTVANLKRFYLNRYLPVGYFNVEVHYNWDTRYSEPDLKFKYVICGPIVGQRR